jgi:hypothetical protein
MKQTAVEWFWLNLTDDLIGDLAPEKILKIHELKEQAKAMERQQIMTAFTQGDIFGSDYYDGVNITEENYYNKIFKSE